MGSICLMGPPSGLGESGVTRARRPACGDLGYCQSARSSASSGTVHAIPQRLSLVGQTVACIQAAIASGQWHDWLPAERTLCETLQRRRDPELAFTMEFPLPLATPAARR